MPWLQIAILIFREKMRQASLALRATVSKKAAMERRADLLFKELRNDAPRVQKMERLIKKGIDTKHYDRSEMHCTPLMRMAQAGSPYYWLSVMLLDRGASLTDPDSYGGLPLHYAAEGGSADVVDLFIRRGAIVDAANKDHATAMVYAVRFGGAVAVEALAKAGASITPPHVGPLLCSAKDAGTAAMLISLGADVNAREGGFENMSPLMKAAKYGQIDQARVLLDAGADTAAMTERSHLTAAGLAVTSGTDNGREVRRLIKETSAARTALLDRHLQQSFNMKTTAPIETPPKISTRHRRTSAPGKPG